MNDKLIYSKLQSSMFPLYEDIVRSIKAVESGEPVLDLRSRRQPCLEISLETNNKNWRSRGRCNMM